MISREEVLKLAELARLKVEDEEVESLQKDISSILDYVGQVSAVQGNTSAKAEELPSVRNVMRADTLRVATDPMADKESTLRAAFPTRSGDHNVVRKIIQKDE